jgi:hypothetical protein
MVKYTRQETIQLAKLINSDREAYRWLKKNDCTELAAFSDAYSCENETALA